MAQKTDNFDYAPQPGSARMTDVARAAGVSLVTVSRAINHPDQVSSKTRTAVRQAIEQLGYVPNLMAGSLASNRSCIIAAIVPTISNLIFAESIGTLSETLKSGGYQLLIGQTNYNRSEEHKLVDAFLGRRVDGLVLMGNIQDTYSRESGSVKPNALTEKLLRARIPIVQMWDLIPTPIDMQVGYSNLEAGRRAGSYLTDKGHRIVGFMGADEARSHARLEGLKAVIVERGGKVLASMMTAPAGIETADIQLGRLLQQDSNLQAVFCNNDLLAAGVLFACRKRGIQVPQQIAVMGLGDMPIAEAAYPKLTTLRVEPRKMGEMAASLMMNRLSGKPMPSLSHDIGIEVVSRDSA